MAVTTLSVEGLLPGWWSRCPQICFFTVILICGGGRWDWTTTPGEKPLRTAALGMFPSGCAHALCEPHVTLVGTALGPTSTMGISAHGPGVPQMFSPSHQHRSGPVKSGPRIAFMSWIHCGAMGHLRLWPGPTPSHTSPQSLLKLHLHDWGSPGRPFRCSVGTELTKSVAGVKPWFVQL